jgi:methionyl-tRNA formyltransferase
MRIIFMGTPDFATHALKALVDAGHEIACVYSQPPRPAGRGHGVKKSPAQVRAEGLGLMVRTPLSLKSPEEQVAFAALKADTAVVVAYGLLLPLPVLAGTRYGCFNIHASLLPRWRGAAPIHRAIMAGDEETGVTIMRMEEGLDTGPMVKVAQVTIKPEMTTADLHDELAAIGAKLMVETLRTPEDPGMPQPTEGITYAKKIDKAEARLDLSRPPIEIRNHIHGLSPFPGAWCLINGTRVKILRARVAKSPSDGGLVHACGAGWIEFLTLQREGKGPMDAATFWRGFPTAPDVVIS